MADDPKPPVATPVPTSGVDPMALIRDANANAERVKGEASKARAEAEARIAELEKSNAESKKQLDSIAKSKMDAVLARLDKLPKEAQEVAALVKGKLSADELSAYLDKIAPISTSSAPAPGAPRGTDGDREPDATLPSGMYRPDPAEAAIYEKRSGQKLTHVGDTVMTQMNGSRTYSIPLVKFRERVKTTSGKDAAGNKSKY